jgi:hypothetical protein
MAMGGAATSPTATNDPSATLRQGYMSSLRSRVGRTGRAAMIGLSMMQAAPATSRDMDEAPQRDHVAELQASRHEAQRYANPGNSAPELQSLAESVRDDGDEEDRDAADDMNESADEIADEAAQAEDLSMLSRAKSRLKAEADEGMQKMLQKGQKELEKATANLKTEGAAKFASAADEGEMFEVADTAGTAVSVGHAALSIFQDSFDETTKELLAKQGYPMLQMSNPLDVAIIAGTNMQILKWSFMVTVLIPFCVVFIVLSVVTACQESFFCKYGTSILSTVSKLIGS